jgi:hypothetical protein
VCNLCKCLYSSMPQSKCDAMHSKLYFRGNTFLMSSGTSEIPRSPHSCSHFLFCSGTSRLQNKHWLNANTVVLGNPWFTGHIRHARPIVLTCKVMCNSYWNPARVMIFNKRNHPQHEFRITARIGRLE